MVWPALIQYVSCCFLHHSDCASKDVHFKDVHLCRLLYAVPSADCQALDTVLSFCY